MSAEPFTRSLAASPVSTLPGPSRRITVEPVEAPVSPVPVPEKSPPSPVTRPDAEPVPAPVPAP